MARVLSSVVVLVVLMTACGDGGTTADDSAATEGVETTTAAEPVTETSGDTDGQSESGDGDAAPEVLHPDVVGVEAVHDGDGSWTFHVTLSSPYDSPDRYADAWRVVGPDGSVYGERILLHDHAAEQPFTRSQSGIEIPDDITIVTVEGRDQISGWGGATMDIALQP